MGGIYDDYGYVLRFAMKYFPSSYIDDEGNECLEPPPSCSWLAWHFDEYLESTGLSKESFEKQDSIAPVLQAYSLDIDKFWRATVYIHKLTSHWAANKERTKVLPSVYHQLVAVRDGIKDSNEFRIIIDNDLESHSIKVESKQAISVILKHLDEAIKEEEGREDMHPVPVWRKGEAKRTEMTWYAANLFYFLLESLELPTIRSRSTITKKQADVSYDKYQLIAELIHFLGFTDNPNLEGNSIKGILRSKKDFHFSELVI